MMSSARTGKSSEVAALLCMVNRLPGRVQFGQLDEAGIAGALCSKHRAGGLSAGLPPWRLQPCRVADLRRHRRILPSTTAPSATDVRQWLALGPQRLFVSALKAVSKTVKEGDIHGTFKQGLDCTTFSTCDVSS